MDGANEADGVNCFNAVKGVDRSTKMLMAQVEGDVEKLSNVDADLTALYRRCIRRFTLALMFKFMILRYCLCYY